MLTFVPELLCLCNKNNTSLDVLASTCALSSTMLRLDMFYLDMLDLWVEDQAGTHLLRDGKVERLGTCATSVSLTSTCVTLSCLGTADVW